MGFGLIKIHKGKISLIEMGVLQLARKNDHAERLEMIYRKIDSLMRVHQPTAVAIEAPFFGKNVQSMLKLGRAQGVAIAAAMMHGLRAIEYSPRTVKQSITGKGSATKEQVWEMLKHSLTIKEEDPRFMDAADAVSVALCHYYHQRIPELSVTIAAPKKRSKKSSWANFAANNPGRVT
jgi:crossover junction endodeoxyribonuclease RuvC